MRIERAKTICRNQGGPLALALVALALASAGAARAQSTSSTQGLRRPPVTSPRQMEPARPAANIPRPVVEPIQNPLNPPQQLHPVRRPPPGLYVLVRDLPSEEQERLLANSVRFQRLPAQRQAQVRQNLQRWNALSPERKQIIREREAILQSLSPPERQQLRTTFPLYRRLPAERRQEVMRAFLHMRDLPLGERQTFISSAEVQERFSGEEREILERLVQLLPNSAP